MCSRSRTRSRARSSPRCARLRSRISSRRRAIGTPRAWKRMGCTCAAAIAWNKRTSEGVGEGIKYFEQAIAADPSYALAYTGLADSYALHIDYRNVPGPGGLREREVLRAEGDRAGRYAGGGARVAGVEPVHLRLGLGGRGEGDSVARSSSIRGTRRRTSGTRSCSLRRGSSTRR